MAGTLADRGFKVVIRRTLATSATVACVAASAILIAQAEPLLITGARVLDVVAGQYLTVAGVLVQKDRIAAIYKTLPPALPPATRKLDYAGATLVPGLGDMNASGSPASDLDVDYFYAMSLAYGVTMHRTLDVPATWAAAQRQRVDAGEVLAPRLWTSGRGIDRWPSPEFWLFQIHDAAQATREVNQQAETGVGWIAGFDNLGPDIYRALVTSARRATLQVSGRPGATSMTQLAQIGVDSIDGLAYPTQPRPTPPNGAPRAVETVTDLRGADVSWIQATSRELTALANLLAKRRRTVVPMLARDFRRAGSEEVGQDRALDQMPASRKQLLFTEMSVTSNEDTGRARQAWPRKLALVAEFVRAGGEVATGTGFERANYPVPGIGIHQEMALLVRAGLTPAEAVRAATTGPAALVGASKSLGQIAQGYRADLFVVDGDPLAQIEDLQKIRVVIRGGEVLDRNALLAQAKRAIVADRPRK